MQYNQIISQRKELFRPTFHPFLGLSHTYNIYIYIFFNIFFFKGD